MDNNKITYKSLDLQLVARSRTLQLTHSLGKSSLMSTRLVPACASKGNSVVLSQWKVFISREGQASNMYAMANILEKLRAGETKESKLALTWMPRHS